MKVVIVVMAALVYPKIAYAYVDPGFLSVLYQFAYVFFFGVLASFILKPWQFLKSWVHKLFFRKQSGSEGQS